MPEAIQPIPDTVEQAPRPPLEANLAQWQERISRLEAEVGQYAGTNEFPEWWYDNDAVKRQQTIVPELKEPGADPAAISEYFDLYSRQLKLHIQISNLPQAFDNPPLNAVLASIGPENISRGFAYETADGPLHQAMLKDFTAASVADIGTLTDRLKTLQLAYGRESFTDLLNIGGDEYSDTLRPLLRSELSIMWIRHTDEVVDQSLTYPEKQECDRKWMTKAVQTVSGLHADEAAEYVFTASRNMGKTSGAIRRIMGHFDHFGADRIRNITKVTGIHGLEGYSTEQLERMEAFAMDPETMAEKLKDHDVNVALINRVGDHNAVMSDIAEDIDDAAARTLFFEITSFADGYRYMSMLKKLGIHPSTILLAAHSAPGQFMVSDVREPGLKRRDIATVAGRKLVRMVNENGQLDPGDRGFSMHGMRGMAKIVGRYMQPSRGIDDAPEDTGRCKIIFSACNAGTEVKSADLDENNEKYQTDMESVISRLGKDLAASDEHVTVDIYGAPSGVQMHRAPKGVYFSSQIVNWDLERPKLHAIRIRVAHNTVSEDRVDEIALRK